MLQTRLIAIELEGERASRTLYVGVAKDVRLAPEAANLFSFLTSLE